MSPPIGSARAGLVSQVGDAIPDSVVLQNTATTWGQGDATWVDDATSDGSQDVSINGDPQDDTLSDGSESLNFDGADDYGLVSLPPELEGSGLQAWSLEFSIQFSHSNENAVFGVRQGDGNQYFLFATNQNENLNSDGGNLSFRLQDESGDEIRGAFQTAQGLNDGNRHDVSIIINDASNNNLDAIVDGSSVGLAFSLQESPSNFATWSRDMAYAARNLDGTIDSNLSVGMGAVRWHKSAIDSQTISDYPF